MDMQTSHLVLGESLVRVLQNLRASWITTVMALGGAKVAQLHPMVQLMNPGKIWDINIFSRHGQRVQELRHKRRSNGVNAGMSFYRTMMEYILIAKLDEPSLPGATR